MNNIDMYCITDKKINFLEKLPFYLGAVGNDKFNEKYILSNTQKNIYYKEKNYSELTFQYWYWKNQLKLNKNEWIGFCQKRRFWLNPTVKIETINEKNFSENLLINIDKKYQHYESFICKPIKVSGVKKIKLLKRGWKNIIKEPSILYDEKKQTILLHFDMHHGYNNLEKAINLLDRSDSDEFYQYVKNRNYFNPHIMFISKPYVVEKWFETLFPWLERCENIFGFKNLKDYDTTRLYAYLAERYLSFWFKKYTKFLECPYFTLNIGRDGREV